MNHPKDKLISRVAGLGDALKIWLESQRVLPTNATIWSSDRFFSLNELNAKAGTLADLARQISTSNADDFLLVPNSRLAALADSLNGLTHEVGNFTNHLVALKHEEGEASFDHSNGTITYSSGAQMPLEPLLTQLQHHIDQGLEAYAPIGAAMKPRAIGTFEAASRALAEKAVEAARLRDELAATNMQSAERLQAIQQRYNELETVASEGSRLLDEAEKARKTIEENQHRSAAAAAAVETTRTQAAELQAQVQAYSADFGSFQKQLDARNQTITQGNENLARLAADLSSKNDAADQLVKKAQEMLGGATFAGLSSTYKTRMDEIDKQVGKARYFFYFSISLLILGVIVALNLLPGLGLPALPPFSEKVPTGSIAIQIFASLGSRALFILPLLLLVGFAAHRHTTLFRLREEYGHKYVMAASVQGFKLQAPKFEEEIAAAVFTEVKHNPATTMDGTSSRRRKNSFLDNLIIPRIEEVFDRVIKSNARPEA